MLCTCILSKLKAIELILRSALGVSSQFIRRLTAYLCGPLPIKNNVSDLRFFLRSIFKNDI